MTDKPRMKYQDGPDAPDLAHQIIADVYRHTSDPDFKWAADELNKQRGLALGIPVSEQLITYELNDGKYQISRADMSRIIDRISENVTSCYKRFLHNNITRETALATEFSQFDGYDCAANVNHQHLKEQYEYRLERLTEGPWLPIACKEALVRYADERMPSAGANCAIENWLSAALSNVDRAYRYEIDFALKPVTKAIDAQIKALENNDPIQKIIGR